MPIANMDERTRLLSPTRPKDDQIESRWENFRKPSAWWLCPTSFVLSAVMTSILAPTVSVISEIVCRQDIYDQTGEWISFPIPEQCRSSQLQARISTYLLFYQLLNAIFCTATVGYWGKFSDRYGRKMVMIIPLFGILFAVINMTIVGVYHESFDYRWLFFGVFIEGLSGGIIAMNSTFHAYLADITNISKRSMAFGFLHFAAFSGMTLGPTLGGFVIKTTDNIFSLFYINIACVSCIILYIFLILPESLTKTDRIRNHGSQRSKPWLENLNIFGALTLIVNPDASIDKIKSARKTVILIAGIYFVYRAFVSISAINDLFALYTKYRFGWDLLDQGYFFSVQSFTRSISLITIIPLFTFLFRRAEIPGIMDIWLIRLGYFMDMIGFILFATAKGEWAFYVGAMINSVAVCSTVSLRSIFTTFFQPTKVGSALAALSVIESIGAILCPILINSVYALTVETEPTTIFWLLSIVFGITFVFSFMVTQAGENGNVEIVVEYDEDDDLEGFNERGRNQSNQVRYGILRHQSSEIEDEREIERLLRT